MRPKFTHRKGGYMCYLLTLLLTIPVVLCAEIREISSFKEIHPYLKPRTLLVLDIDNTLIYPAQEVGSDQWFHSRIDYYRQRGYSYSDALDFALPEWEAVQNVTQVKLVEPYILDFLRSVQKDTALQVMGMSTRGLGLAKRTVHQLETLSIDLSKTAPSRKELPFLNSRAILFRKGVFFTACTHKGKALKMFLDEIGYHPQQVVFVNDKRGHLRQVEETLEEHGIPYVGLRYGYLDQKVKNFRKDIADVQYEAFQKIMSDIEAEKILASKGG
jgi:hypothetical protein